MHSEISPTSTHLAITRLATSQRGLATTQQLHSCGLSRHEIHGAVRRGQLHRLHRGVYAVGHTALSPLAAEQAALLAYGDDAVLSHGSAAYVWKLCERPEGPIEVTVAGRKLRSRPGTRLHEAPTVTDRDVRLRQGLRVTSPVRTLVDMAASGTSEQFARLLSEARYLGLVRPGELERFTEQAACRNGLRLVRDHLRSEERPAVPRSNIEALFLRQIRSARLPEPRTQLLVCGHRVDAAWPEHRLIVELDGWAGHGHRSAFERDRRRDAELVAAGWRVIRFTAYQLEREPLFVIAAVAAGLRAGAGAAA